MFSYSSLLLILLQVMQAFTKILFRNCWLQNTSGTPVDSISVGLLKMKEILHVKLCFIKKAIAIVAKHFNQIEIFTL